MKKPWLAAILNFVFPGLGYLYNGRRKVFAFLLLGGIIAGLIANPPYVNLEVKHKIYMWLSAILLVLAFAYDAYNEAKSLNKKK